MRQRRKAVSENPETLIAEVEEAPEQGRFFACYLLTSRSPRHKGHTYIGFTVNPRRRIRQHNGEIAHGAWKTKRKRPWDMVLCIYGFPTNVSALQFEWAWQNPTVSKAVRQAAASFKTLGGLANKVKLAYTMLTLPPWQSLNITVNFFSTQYMNHCAGCPRLPEQMKVKVCPMDELPSCTKRSDDVCEDEDEWCNARECDEDMNSSQEETLLDFAFHSSQDEKQNDVGNGSNEEYRTITEVGENEWWNDKEYDVLEADMLSSFAVHNSAEDQQGDARETIIEEVHGSNEVVEEVTEKLGFVTSPVRNDREWDELMNDIILQEGVSSYFSVHNSAEDEHGGAGRPITKVHGSNEEEEELSEKLGFITSPVRSDKECDEAMDGIGLQEGMLSHFAVHNSAEDRHGSNEEEEQELGFITSPVRRPSSNVSTSSDTQVPKDFCLVQPSDDRSNRVELTTVVADDDQSPSRGYLRPCVARVIDLTTPSPLCRNGLCGKKSRTITGYPQIIDLTKSPNFIQL